MLYESPGVPDLVFGDAAKRPVALYDIKHFCGRTHGMNAIDEASGEKHALCQERR